MARPKSDDPVKPFSIGLATSAWAEVDAAAERANLSRGQWVKDAIFAKLALGPAASRPPTPIPDREPERVPKIKGGRVAADKVRVLPADGVPGSSGACGHPKEKLRKLPYGTFCECGSKVR